MPIALIAVGIMAFAIIYTIQTLNRHRNKDGNPNEGPGTLLFGLWIGFWTVGVFGLMILAGLALIAVFAPFILPVAIIITLYVLWKKAVAHNTPTPVYAQRLRVVEPTWVAQHFECNIVVGYGLVSYVSSPVNGVYTARVDLVTLKFANFLRTAYKPDMAVARSTKRGNTAQVAVDLALQELQAHQDLSWLTSSQEDALRNVAA